jgi:hypothetical protein
MNLRSLGAFALAGCIVVYAAERPTNGGSAQRDPWQRDEKSGNISTTTDWYAFAGGAARDGWEPNEQRFAKDEVKDFRLLFEHYIGNTQTGVGAVLPPVVLGKLVEKPDLKELAFVAGSRNGIWVIDADVDKPYWEKRFDSDYVSRNRKKRKPVHGCDADLTAAPALPGPGVFQSPSIGRPRLNAVKFGQPRPVYLLTGDGLLRQLNQADGTQPERPRHFVPGGVAAKPLNVFEDVLYTATRAGCGHEAAVWSLDAADPDAKPKSIRLGTEVVGTTGVALDAEGRAFIQTADGPLDPVHGKYGGSLVELDKNLAVAHYFVMPNAPEKKAHSTGMNETSPVVFTFNHTELVVSAAKDGRLYVLRASDFGTDGHHRYISKSVVVPAMDGERAHGIWGNLASWQDADGARYVLATVWGPLSADLMAAVPDSKAPNGSVVAFKVEENQNGAAQLKPAWISRDLDTPTPPVIAKGVVFALANGRFYHPDSTPVPHRKTHATLFAFDGLTGDQIYSTGEQVKQPGNLTGLTIANGRVYFLTVDNTLEVFGKPIKK